MRAPTDLPRRRMPSNRGRITLAIVVAILFVLALSLRGIAGFYTDFLWFDGLSLAGVWRAILGAKVALSVIFMGLFFVLLFVNLSIADRVAPRFRPPGPEEELVERYRELVGGHTGLVRVVASLLFALIVGAGTSVQWNDWILFTHRVSFKATDPLFHRDVSFYVFTLPFLKFLVDWAFAAMVIVLIVTTVAHYLNGGIRVQVPSMQRVTPQVKAHLSLLLGGLALLKAVAYYLERYELTYSTRGVVDGAGYTDVKAQLPALQLLVIISVLAFVLLIVNIRMRGFTLPIIAVGLWAFTSVVIGGLYPAFIQKFKVEPNQSVRERPYIARNIAATRKALGLDHVSVKNFAYNENLDAKALADNSATIRNVRLWDPTYLKQTYAQLQEIRRFYTFNDVDVDRYRVAGQTAQVMLSARELDQGNVPSSWENTHLNFTHGYGAVLSPANAVTSDGLPDFLVKDLPPTGSPALNQPAIYYGEHLSGYAIVRTKRQEIDYQKKDGTTARTTYHGDGGVAMSSLIRRLAFALRFGDMNPLISNFITPQSRALYIRDINDRVRKVAPFLSYDGDPYPVVVNGQVQWIVDAYTTTSRYPYAQRASGSRLANGSGLATRINYVRNSVKVVINAYDGTMTFYVVDTSDPIVRAYQKAFPKLFSAKSVPAELRAHFRYPEDLFRLQTNMYATYHITSAADFYDKGDAWDIAKDPGSGTVSGDTTAAPAPAIGTAGAAATDTTGGVPRMDPYYLLMRLPDETQESFLILQPFNPSGKDLLSAFMIAKSDPDDYGKLEVFVMPRDRSVNGPTQIDARINQEPTISTQLSLLDQRGSRVIKGNLLVIPVNNSLLYIRPLYVEATSTQLPELKLVVVAYGNQVVAKTTLRDALAAIFGAAPATQERNAGGTTGTGTPPPSGPSGPAVNSTVAQLLDQAAAQYDAAQTALKSGDLATYQKDIDQMNKLVQQARQQSGSGTGSGSPGSSTTPTTRPPGGATTSTTAPASA